MASMYINPLAFRIAAHRPSEIPDIGNSITFTASNTLTGLHYEYLIEIVVKGRRAPNLPETL